MFFVFFYLPLSPDTDCLSYRLLFFAEIFKVVWFCLVYVSSQNAIKEFICSCGCACTCYSGVKLLCIRYSPLNFSKRYSFHFEQPFEIVSSLIFALLFSPVNSCSIHSYSRDSDGLFAGLWSIQVHSWVHFTLSNRFLRVCGYLSQKVFTWLNKG